MLPILQLKKNEDRRIRAGHPWIYSNEIDVRRTPLKNFKPGEEVIITAHDNAPLGVAYVNPHSLIAARLFSTDLKDRLDIPFLTEKIRTAINLRDSLFDKPFYRLIFSEGDGLPGIVVDRFNEDLVVQINTYGMELRKDLVITALLNAIPQIKSILFKNDSGTRSQEGLTTEITPGFGDPPKQVFLEENQVQFYTPSWEGQKTGWFYDHRCNRQRLATYVKNKKVLDVFSYVGAWGVQAAKFGAQEVFCVDSSLLAIHWLKENIKLNRVENQVTVIHEEAFESLKHFIQKHQQFDIIILDPPAFIKKQKDKKEGIMAYRRLNELALKLLAKNGILISCSCSMHLSPDELQSCLQWATLKVKCQLQILERGHQGPDHPIHIAIPETDYLKMIIARKN